MGNHLVHRSRTCGVFQMEKRHFRLGDDRRYLTQMIGLLHEHDLQPNTYH